MVRHMNPILCRLPKVEGCLRVIEHVNGTSVWHEFPLAECVVVALPGHPVMSQSGQNQSLNPVKSEPSIPNATEPSRTGWATNTIKPGDRFTFEDAT